ncbi:MAG TPA: hypothetical protein PKD86_13545 [Gemmatales bacterium]|nr:hypothetical protein [Gemmatales bacterium]HMP60366.1 hypothetical protein [Gemmatales bacterium]
MQSERFLPNIDRVETHDGARYTLDTAHSSTSNVVPWLVFAAGVPLAAALLASWFLWQHFGRVSLGLTALAGLFVVQMLLTARVPARLFCNQLWHHLTARFGRGEIALRGERLWSGNSVGIFRSGQCRDVGDFQRIAVAVYRSSPPIEAAEPASESQRHSTLQHVADQQVEPGDERAVLVIEAGTTTPWLLLDGYSRSETLALAEDLERRITAVRARQTARAPLPRVVIVETEERSLYPPLPADFDRRRQPWWLALHLAGATGLGALTAMAGQAGALQNGLTKIAILFGWLLELLLIAITARWGGTPDQTLGGESAE